MPAFQKGQDIGRILGSEVSPTGHGGIASSVDDRLVQVFIRCSGEQVTIVDGDDFRTFPITAVAHGAVVVVQDFPSSRIAFCGTHSFKKVIENSSLKEKARQVGSSSNQFTGKQTIRSYAT